MRTRIEISAYELPLRVPMRARAGLANVRIGLHVHARGEDGVVGIGETAPLDAGELAQARAILEAASAVSPDVDTGSADSTELVARVSAIVERWLGPTAPPSARCGLETSLLDLLARREGRAVTELLGGVAGACLEVNALITDEDADAAGRRAAGFIGRGFRTLKLKVGDVDSDLARIRSVLAAAEPVRASAASFGGALAGVSCTLRLDANRGWDYTSAAALWGELEGMAIDYVEEPLSAPIPHVLARLRRRSVLGLALDESISTLADFQRFASVGACDVLVLKLQRVGGPSAALRLAAAAHEKGVRVVLTDSLETAVGRAATLHCAAACRSEAVGLAGAFLMSGESAGHDRPRIRLVGPGLGVRT